jgi:nucleoside 2-deoxyribosyltransferase
MSVTCIFCNNNFDYSNGNLQPTKTNYICSRCGHVFLTEECVDDFEGERFSERNKIIISISLRIDYERRNHKLLGEPLTIEMLWQIVNQYTPLDALEKMDNALINIARKSQFIGEKIHINVGFDYPVYHCSGTTELQSILRLLCTEDLLYAFNPGSPEYDISVTAKGYQRLREIMKPGKDSKQCFVAMWFTPEMNEIFKKVIKPAIEFIEKGELSPRFEAIKIDNVEHNNDINDEIIGQIRRSRFMVCDLTGYRGGIYFEAGFAYGLGLEVIYTCRKDWCEEQVLKDNNGQDVPILYDNYKNEIQIKKEGVHFDLTHRNRIEWTLDNLDEFRIRLQKRIKAIIV